MGIVKISAYFQICPSCGFHGRVILEGRKVSNEVFSKASFRHEVSELLFAGVISKEEKLFLETQLPDSWPENESFCDSLYAEENFDEGVDEDGPPEVVM